MDLDVFDRRPSPGRLANSGSLRRYVGEKGYPSIRPAFGCSTASRMRWWEWPIVTSPGDFRLIRIGSIIPFMSRPDVILLIVNPDRNSGPPQAYPRRGPDTRVRIDLRHDR